MHRLAECILQTFVLLYMLQIALINVMRTLGITPDGILGHSVGELACGFADGGLTLEETMLTAFWRSQCVTEANLPEGGMASIGEL